ncbi:MAG TPA: hypothetical protein VE093_06355 [Polyangiaceae bacterium]|nr:hypothetical protein [Polyangiaceae bacterium]
MTTNLANAPRPEKLSVVTEIHTALVERMQAGPPEPALDAFIPELAAVRDKLATHVDGKTTANAAREKHLARAANADRDVGAQFRHIEAFLSIEANRQSSPHQSSARALYNAAFPDGLAHIDDRIATENIHVRATLSALKSPEHADTLAAIQLPSAWITALEAALNASNAALADLTKARGERASHVDLGKSAEAEWVDLMVRLRRYIESRAKRTDVARVAEGKELIKPLLDVVQKLRAKAAARATRRAKKNEEGATPAAPSATPTAPSATPAAPSATPAAPSPPAP